MKKCRFLIALLVFLCLCSVLVFTSCEEDETQTPNGDEPDTEQTSGRDETPEGEDEATSITVTYNANGGMFANGQVTATQTVEADGLLTAPTSPTRTNYIFSGWSKKQSVEELWQFAADSATENITLYAVWVQESAVVLSVDGATIKGTSIHLLVDRDTDSVSLSNKVVCSNDSIWRLYYDKLGQTEIPTKIAAGMGGSLVGGDNMFYIVVTSNDGTKVNAYELTVHRSYAATVSYYNGTELLKTQTAYTGEPFSVTYNPSITGYTFNSWKDADGNVVNTFTPWESVSLYADKTVNTYTVTYDANGGTVNGESQAVTYDQTYSFVLPTRTGYSFTGWYYGNTQLTDSKGKSIGEWSVAKDVTAKATWSPNTYTLTLDNNSSSAGTVIGAGDYAYDQSITIKATPKNGYTFLGWYDKSGNLVTENSSYTFKMGFDTTYTAKWTYYTVTTSQNINAAGSVSSHSNTKVTVGNTVTLKATTYLGYTWLGWYNGDDLVTDQASYRFTMGTNNVSYTAKWALKDEMSGFNFTSDASTCTITGVKDTTVTSITVPDYVTSINRSAFKGCSSLESLTLPFAGESINGTSNTHFGYIFGASSYSSNASNVPTSLTKVILTGGKSIGAYAFQDCSCLESITIGESVKSIGEFAFNRCTALTEINFNATAMDDLGSELHAFSKAGRNGSGITVNIGVNVTKIPAYLFDYYQDNTYAYAPKIVSVVFADNSQCESIGEYAFNCCRSLESITIPSSVTMSIDANAFRGCDSLIYTICENGRYLGNEENLYVVLVDVTDTAITSFTIQSTTKVIMDGAFSYCRGLTSITIPSSVTSIGAFAFDGCRGLTSITIGESVKRIGKAAFKECTALTDINFNATAMDDMGYEYYSDDYVFESAGKRGSGITVNIGANVTKISSYLFCGDDETNDTFPQIVSVVFAENSQCESIGKYAFYSCRSLETITIPSSVTSIGEAAFYYCSSLEKITIPSLVTSIGKFAFWHCHSLTSVTFEVTSGWNVGDSLLLANPNTAATYLTDTYKLYDWKRS